MDNPEPSASFTSYFSPTDLSYRDSGQGSNIGSDKLLTQDLPLLSNGEVNCSIWLPADFKPTIFDHWPVTCVFRHRVPGLSFISSKADNEFMHGARNDELLQGDVVELQFIYAYMLHKEGHLSIQFPQYYYDAHELKTNPISKTVGKDCPFFFELGEKLCEIIPEYDWPVADIRRIFISARNQRFAYLQLKKQNADISFINGMTFKERKMYNKIIGVSNSYNRGNKGAVSLDSFLDSLDYFNR